MIIKFALNTFLSVVNGLAYSFFKSIWLPNMYDNYKQNWWGLELYSEFFWVNIRQLKAWRNWQYISTKSVKYTSMKYINVLLIFTYPRQPYPSCVYTQGLAWDIVIYSLLSIYIHVWFTPLVYPTVNWPKLWIQAD